MLLKCSSIIDNNTILLKSVTLKMASLPFTDESYALFEQNLSHVTEYFNLAVMLLLLKRSVQRSFSHRSVSDCICKTTLQMERTIVKETNLQEIYFGFSKCNHTPIHSHTYGAGLNRQ